MLHLRPALSFFFFNHTATTEIYTLSLHDALPIYCLAPPADGHAGERRGRADRHCAAVDRKSTRLNSSHLGISYAVFCLKKKKNRETIRTDLIKKQMQAYSELPRRAQPRLLTIQLT